MLAIIHTMFVNEKVIRIYSFYLFSQWKIFFKNHFHPGGGREKVLKNTPLVQKKVMGSQCKIYLTVGLLKNLWNMIFPHKFNHDNSILIEKRKN